MVPVVTENVAVGTVVDPDLLDSNVRRLAGGLERGLTANNIAGGTLPRAKVTSWQNVFTTKTESDPGFTTNGWFTYGGVGGTAVDVNDEPVWDSVCDLVVDAHDAPALVIAAGTYGTQGHFRDVAALNGIYDNDATQGSSRTEFCLLLDGAEVPGTRTGFEKWPDFPYQQWYKATDVAGAAFDYRHLQTVKDVSGFGCNAHPFRLMFSVPFTAGTRTLSIGARRLPTHDREPENNGAGSCVQIFNRQLHAFFETGRRAQSGLGTGWSIKAWRELDAVTAAEINTNRYSKIRTRSLALPAASVRGGALTRSHLNSIVVQSDASALFDINPMPCVTVYPGYGTATAGWSVVQDPSGHLLQVTRGGAGWDFSQNGRYVVVLANVETRFVGSNANVDSDLRWLGCFAIQFVNAAGAVWTAPVSEGYINSNLQYDTPAIWTGQLLADIEDDVPITFVTETSAIPNAFRQPVSIRVVVSGWSGRVPSAGVPQVTTHYASLFAALLEG